MADHHYSLNLLGVMDGLWFHQNPISPLSPKSNITPPQTIGETTLITTSSNPFLSPSLDHEVSSNSSPNITSHQDDHELDNTDDEIDEPNYKRKRRSRSRSRCLSLSPSVQKHPKSLRGIIGRERTLQKTMSCKSLSELECEEVKGFMDLGFTFEKEALNPRMMSMIPGLQRIGEYDVQNVCTNNDDDIGVTRPYLSEAWLINRPDSPLLNLRLPPVSATVDMKKHIRFWARTVASVIRNEF